MDLFLATCRKVKVVSDSQREEGESVKYSTFLFTSVVGEREAEREMPDRRRATSFIPGAAR